MKRQIARLLVIILAVPLGESATALSQQATPAKNQPSQSGTQSATAVHAKGDDLTQARANLDYPDAPAPATAQSDDQSTTSSSAASAGEPQQSQPVGTAAAPYERPSGVAVSRPAGAAIAPAKQRRSRAIYISLGVVVAAGVAAGTIVGLSHASPGRPH